MAEDWEFSERVVVLLWRWHKSQTWLAGKLGFHPQTVKDKMRSRNGNRWRDEERDLVAATLGTTLDRRGLPRLDSNQQPAGSHTARVA